MSSVQEKTKIKEIFSTLVETEGIKTDNEAEEQKEPNRYV